MRQSDSPFYDEIRVRYIRRLAEQAHEPPGRALSRARRTRRLVGLHDEGDCLNIPDSSAESSGTIRRT